MRLILVTLFSILFSMSAIAEIPELTITPVYRYDNGDLLLPDELQHFDLCTSSKVDTCENISILIGTVVSTDIIGDAYMVKTRTVTTDGAKSEWSIPVLDRLPERPIIFRASSVNLQIIIGTP